MNVNTPKAPPTLFTSSEHWSIPATHPQAVYAFAELQVLTEHLARVEQIDVTSAVASDRREAANALVAIAERRANDLTDRIRKAVKPKILPLFEDLDVARAIPDQIAILPRVVWLLGALAALAAVRAASAEASISAISSGDDWADAFARAIRRSVTDARSRWDTQADELLRRHPWVKGQHVHFELVDLETKHPRFRIPVTGD